MPDFYPRSPCGERLSDSPENLPGTAGFLSTLSLRRATVAATPPLVELVISIHALLAESDFLRKQYALAFQISIHALLAESDLQSS